MAILTVQFVGQTHFTVTTICQNLSQSMAAIHDSVVIIMYAFLSTQTLFCYLYCTEQYFHH